MSSHMQSEDVHYVPGAVWRSGWVDILDEDLLMYMALVELLLSRIKGCRLDPGPKRIGCWML